MSTVCQNFVQNTWKKDFCSNCFKSKDEHSNVTPKSGGYFSAFHNKSPKFSSKSSTGILRLSSPKKKSKHSVSFPQELTKIIGYGGEVWSDDEEFQMSEDTGDDDVFPDCEEEKQLKQLTKSNTDFNTVKENLLGSNGETKKSYTSLLLGKMQTDSDGKKKTLLVSVTPFGHDNSVKNTISKLNNDSKSPVASLNKTKDNRNGDYKTNIILTSFVKNTDSPLPNTPKKDDNHLVVSEKSLLEEISETLEKNRINVSKNNLGHNETKKSHIYSNIVNGKCEDSSRESEPEKSIDTTDYKKNTLTRNTPVKKDSEKPKITMMPKAHQEFTFCKIDIEPAKPEKNVENEINNKKYAIDSSKSMASDEDSTSSKSDSDIDERQYIETCNPLKKSEAVKIQVFSDGKDTDSDDKASSDVSLDDIRKVDGQSDGSLQDTYEIHFQPQILDLPPIIPKIDQSIIFPLGASRESAGEPDGRADPEDMSEPPALPRSPPPQVDPRPSFLHGMFKDSNICRPTVPEKPKLPVKPLSVIKQVTKRPQANVLPQQQQTVMHVQTLNAPVRACTPEPSPVKEEVEVCETVIAGNDNNDVTYDENDDYEICSKTPLGKQDSNGSINLTPNKRKAPKPPPPGIDETSGTIYQRNPTANIKSDSPVVREKEKRERASSCSPKFRQGVNLNPTGNQPKPQNTEKLPEPAPRRSISLSHDNLVDEKKKNKSKFSLRKLLRIGSSKDLDKKDLQVPFESTIIRKDEFADNTPKPKPRLVIIHPLELNGSSVEVLKSTSDLHNIKGADNISISDDSTYSGFSAADSEEIPVKEVTTKPPPPPRKFTEDVCTVDGCPTKPARPPPPKSAALLKQQKQAVWSSITNNKPTDNVYANLGEVRSAIAPRKPERTASMREREAQLELPKKRYNNAEDSDGDIDCSPIPNNTNNNINKVEITHTTSEQQSKHNYDDVYGSEHKYESANENHRILTVNGNDNDYEFVSNCTSNALQNNLASKKAQPLNASLNRLPLKTMVQNYRKSDCSINKSTEYMKFNNFTRSTSLTYYGSETESEIYSPYSFYSCSEVNENELNGDFSNGISINNTTNKLRVRKGRSVVHKNLEDNYGAVVIANHEALAQVLEQVQQSAIMQSSLRGLKTCTNLRWNDFTITSTPLKELKTSAAGSLRVGKRVFYSAVWNSNSAHGAVNVTLMLHKDQMASQLVSQQIGHQQAFCLNAVTEFCDLVPLQQFGEEGDQLVQATVVVLPRTQVDTVHTFGDYLKIKGQNSPSNTLQKSEKELPITSEYQHEATFVMLQMINGLKCLQARGVEEVPASLSSFVIVRDHQMLINGSQNGSCNLSDVSSEDGPPSIQMPKANSYGRLCILQGLIEETVCHTPHTDEKMSSLCECAVTSLKLLIPDGKLAILIDNLLKQEKSISLSQVKSILEFTLWGPIDVVLGLPVKERELSLQRWLDLERATVLHGLVRSRVQLNIFEQSHLMFLVRSSARAMCEASVLLESSSIY